jgi:lipopolysaccharide/colanic/teichoic acid biosynthesis glycosyltransferase
MAAKRLFDLVAASLGLIMLMPVFVVLALLIRVFLGSPVIFRQVRPGRHARPFTLYKFRSMTDKRDDAGRLLPDTQRLTSFGRLLRATSLDELPELYNVLKGEMSLVGPRPLLVRYTPYFTANEMRRFSVLPGITGWAQIRGRNDASWDQRLGDDIWYVDNRSLWLDLKILGMTVAKVLKRDGVAADPSAVMLDLDEERKNKGAC